MRKLITILLLFACTQSFATVYFVSESDGNDSDNGLTSPNAWRSIAKVNTFNFVAGDIIQFKCGDIFIGTIIPKVSGITYTYYSTGAKPVINGLTTISSWTSLGSNIYEATVPGGLQSLSMVVINGVPTPMGRYPNLNTDNGGYLTYETFQNYVSITDNQLPASPNWTGADLLVRRNPFSTNRLTITNHTGTKITFPGAAGTEFLTGLGYFIENHIATLDQNGEWFYDTLTHKIKMYYTSTPPTIQVSTQLNLVKMEYSGGSIKSNIIFNGLSFMGSESQMVSILFANNILFNGCDFQYAGECAIFHKYNIGLTVQNCNIRDVNMIGIEDYGGTIGSGTTVTGSSFRNIGMQPGMISKSGLSVYQDGASSCGIVTLNQNVLVSRNVFDSIGYCAVSIRTNKENQLIDRNIISNFCHLKNDGGAIYNSGWRTNPPIAGYTMITNNIIHHSLDASAGTARPGNAHARGIYLDATSERVQVLNNSIYSVWDGMYISQAQEIIVKGNTIFDVGFYQTGAIAHSAMYFNNTNTGMQPTINNHITNNIFFAKFPLQTQMYIADNFGGAANIGIIDTNRYINTSGINYDIFLRNLSDISTLYNFSEFRTVYPGYNANSSISPLTTPVITQANADTYLRHETNPSDTVKIVRFPGLRYQDAAGTIYDHIASIPAWNSWVGIANGSAPFPNQPPIANAGAPQTITLPVNSVTLTGSATDDGTISTWAWTKFSGPASHTFGSASSASTLVSNLTEGIYQFQLIVTDNLGLKDTALTTVTVIGAVVNTPPTANAGIDKTITLPVSSSSATGTFTNGSGTSSTYLWTQLAGGPNTATITNSTTLTATFSGLIQGDYTFQFQVTNNLGDVANDVMTVHVLPAAPVNNPPTANAGSSQTITLPVNSVNLTGIASTDTDGTITGYAWTQISGPSIGVFGSANSMTTTFVSLVEGIYIVRLTVTDNLGATGNVSISITVNAAIPNTLPTIDPVNDQNITLPVNSIDVVATASDADGTIVSINWTKVFGGAATITPTGLGTATISNLAEGSYTFEATATDDDGGIATTTMHVTVNPVVVANIPPSADPGIYAPINYPNNITLSGIGRDTDGTITTYLWTGPGAILTPNSATTLVVGLPVGTHTFTLTVTDDDGATDSKTVDIIVNPTPAVQGVLLMGYIPLR